MPMVVMPLPLHLRVRMLQHLLLLLPKALLSLLGQNLQRRRRMTPLWLVVTVLPLLLLILLRLHLLMTSPRGKERRVSTCYTIPSIHVFDQQSQGHIYPESLSLICRRCTRTNSRGFLLLS